MGRFATNIAVEFDAITAAGSSTLLGSLLQQRTDALAARRRVDTEIADSAEIAFKGQLNDEMQRDEAEQLAVIPFSHQQTGIVMTQLLL